MSGFFLEASFLSSAYILPKEIARKVFKCLHLFSKDPRHPSLYHESLSGKATGLQSLRVDEKYRVIMLAGDPVPILLYVGIHDEAYRFADRTEAVPALAVREPRLRSAIWPGPGVTQAPVEVRTVEALVVRGPKYLPLSQFLLAQQPNVDSLRVSFGRIEQILATTLPPSARKHRAWWSNGRDRRVQAPAWLSVGWKVSKVNQHEEWVVFGRTPRSGKRGVT